jgi:hypothetical protein
LIIPMIIQTIILDPSGAVWTDEPSNVSRLDRSGAVQIDAEHPSRNRKVAGLEPLHFWMEGTQTQGWPSSVVASWATDLGLPA